MFPKITFKKKIFFECTFPNFLTTPQITENFELGWGKSNVSHKLRASNTQKS